jgi:hypothetical protein
VLPASFYQPSSFFIGECRCVMASFVPFFVELFAPVYILLGVRDVSVSQIFLYFDRSIAKNMTLGGSLFFLAHATKYRIMLILLTRHHFFVAMLREVTTVAEWLDGGVAAATESDAVANFIDFSICRPDRDASSHPNRTTGLHLRVFD